MLPVGGKEASLHGPVIASKISARRHPEPHPRSRLLARPHHEDTDMADEKHEQALDLTEQALEKLNKGDEKAADDLLGKAKALDSSAPEEVVADMDEDAASRDKA